MKISIAIRVAAVWLILATLVLLTIPTALAKSDQPLTKILSKVAPDSCASGWILLDGSYGIVSGNCGIAGVVPCPSGSTFVILAIGGTLTVCTQIADAPAPAPALGPCCPGVKTRPDVPVPPRVPIGASGDAQSFFDGSANIPQNALPNGYGWVIYRPDPAGLPRGTFTMRGGGDRLLAVIVEDANGNRVYSFNGLITVCMNASNSEVMNGSGLSGITLQMWNGSIWVNVPITSITTTATGYQFCTQVSSF